MMMKRLGKFAIRFLKKREIEKESIHVNPRDRKGEYPYKSK